MFSLEYKPFRAYISNLGDLSHTIRMLKENMMFEETIFVKCILHTVGKSTQT